MEREVRRESRSLAESWLGPLLAGRSVKRLEEGLCWIVPHVPPTTQSVKGFNWTELNWTALNASGCTPQVWDGLAQWPDVWLVSARTQVWVRCGLVFSSEIVLCGLCLVILSPPFSPHTARNETATGWGCSSGGRPTGLEHCWRGFDSPKRQGNFLPWTTSSADSLTVFVPRREAGDVWCLPPVWNLRAVIWFLFAISSLVLRPRPVTPSVLSFSAWRPFLLNFFQRIRHYFSLRDRLFWMAPV